MKRSISVTTRNPFIEIPVWLRYFILCYYFIYLVIIPLNSLTNFETISFSIIGVVLLSIISSTLQYLPIILPFKNIGVLHPLIIPIFIGLAKDIFETFGGVLVTPFISTITPLNDTVAFSLTSQELVEANVKYQLATLIGWVAFYIGYFQYIKFKHRVLKFNFGWFLKIKPRNVAIVGGVVGLLALAIFIYGQGGVTQYMSSWGTSRRDALAGFGPLLAILSNLYIFPALWYLWSGEGVFKNPIFIVIFIVSIFSGYLLMGSRSSILTAGIPFLLIWMFRKQQLPITRFLLLGSSFLLLFGLLGQLRSSAYDHNIDWSVITESSVSEAVRYSRVEAESWEGLGASISVFHSVPDKVDFLYGKPYSAVLLFWIPRSIWENKPNGTGKYVGSKIFGRSEAGIPPGEVADVFFNVGWIGLPFLFMLKGLIIAWLTRVYMNAHYRTPLLFLIFLILYDFSLSTSAMVSSLQDLVVIFLIFQFVTDEAFVSKPMVSRAT